MSTFYQGAVASNCYTALLPTLFAEPSVLPNAVADRQLASAAALPGLPVPQRQHVRHLLFGALPAVQITIRQLHQLGYAEVNDWSRPISTGRPDEVMAILTKRVVLE